MVHSSQPTYAQLASRYLKLRTLLTGMRWRMFQDVLPTPKATWRAMLRDATYVTPDDLDLVLDTLLTQGQLTLTLNGLLRTHAAEQCAAHAACCVHRPSDHPLRDAPLRWRGDRALMERVCAHGVGHPDPDHLAFVRRYNPALAEEQAVHGCCGCCAPKKSSRPAGDDV